jgi:hypothetical protein
MRLASSRNVNNALHLPHHVHPVAIAAAVIHLVGRGSASPEFWSFTTLSLKQQGGVRRKRGQDGGGAVGREACLIRAR